MKKKLVCLAICTLVMTAVIISAFAAELNGRIWTGSPKRTLGIVYGYYCTAAQNKSSKGTNQWAYARSTKGGTVIARGEATGNDKAIADSGLDKPTGGYGEYGEDYGKAYQSFGAGAYLDY